MSLPGAADHGPERIVYLDHGATSWPKPPEVIAAVTDALENAGGNAGRGAYGLAVKSARILRRLLGLEADLDLGF